MRESMIYVELRDRPGARAHIAAAYVSCQRLAEMLGRFKAYSTALADNPPVAAPCQKRQRSSKYGSRQFHALCPDDTILSRIQILQP
jgi:hypothetical protein